MIPGSYNIRKEIDGIFITKDLSTTTIAANRE